MISYFKPFISNTSTKTTCSDNLGMVFVYDKCSVCLQKLVFTCPKHTTQLTNMAINPRSSTLTIFR